MFYYICKEIIIIGTLLQLMTWLFMNNFLKPFVLGLKASIKNSKKVYKLVRKIVLLVFQIELGVSVLFVYWVIPEKYLQMFFCILLLTGTGNPDSMCPC